MADISVIAAPIRRGGINENELSFVTSIEANCATVGYNAARTMILNTSLMCFNFLFSQLLANIPAAIVPSPIHRNGNIPERNCPTIC